MERSLRQLGICSTCNHLEECIARKNWKGPVTFCEEYDDYLPPRIVISNDDKNGLKHEPRKKELSEFKGLCMNCEARKRCKFPKTEGGIWHCEEYK